MKNYGYDEGFGGASSPGVAGPLIGGGIAQVGMLATKLLFKGKPGIVRWAPVIGFGLAGAVTGALAMRRKTRGVGIAGLITAALVTLPRQVENMLPAGTLGGYLGVVTAEEGMGDYDGASGIQLMEGAGSGGMGVVTAEEGMNGAEGVDLLGSGGAFGSNYFAQ